MKQRKSEINWKLVVRVACLMLLDVMLLYLACLLALLSRFDLSIHTLMRDSGFLPALHAAFPWMAIGMIALFIPLKLYSSLWEFAGVEELLHILCACFLFAAATLLLILFGVLDLPRSFPVLAGLYLVALLSASRFSYRLIRTILHRSGSEKRKKRTMLIGAGSAGMLVLREFQTSENSQNNVVCVIDDTATSSASTFATSRSPERGTTLSHWHSPAASKRSCLPFRRQPCANGEIFCSFAKRQAAA